MLRVASLLIEQGIAPGDRVGYLGLNDPKFLEFLYASTLIGAIFVPVNYRLTSQEIAFIAADAGLSILCADEQRAEMLEDDLEKLVCARRLGVNFGSATWQSADELLDTDTSESVDHDVAAPVKAGDVALIMYTSGTTGRPKGAQLTHGNIFWNLLNAKFMEDTLRGATLTCAPLFHIGGLNVTTHPSLMSGVQVVLHREFNAGQILDDIERYRISTMFGAPTMFDMMMREPGLPTRTLALCSHSIAVRHQFLCLSSMHTLTRESVFVRATGSPKPHLCQCPQYSRGPTEEGPAGVPLMFTEVKILGANDEPLPAMEKGEIVVRGPNVTPGYWQLPDATLDAFDQLGWFRTGDIGYQDDEGFLFICDRKKDMIITGGENVYPAEVESELLAHPDIAEVAVVGLPDEKWGETVAAVITLSGHREPSLKELDQFLADRLARYKRPRAVHVTDLLPRNPAGKVQKFALRDALAG